MTVQQTTADQADRTGDAPAVQQEGVSGDEATAERALSLDVAFDVLQNERRRRVLRRLWELEDGRATLGALAEHVAAIENDTTTDALTAKQRKRVYVGLYQSHLPKLDEAGVVEFDENRGTVAVTDRADQLEQYLDRDDSAIREYAVPLAAAAAVALYLGAVVALPTLAAHVAGVALLAAVGVLAVVLG